VKTVFADTGYWTALLNPNDQLHSRATAVSKSLDNVRILTTEMVLDELLAALSKVQVRRYAIMGVQAIRSDPNVEVIPQTSLQFSAAFHLYCSVSDKEWSLTDCDSFNVMRARGLTEALAHDRHFKQAGFAALLREPADKS
jgi:predicted nucleic acid-binding protein